MTIGEIPATMYGLSDNGWMESEIFHQWFTHHFLVHASPVRPLLLLLDGHSTHFSPGFITKAAYEKVIVFCLPPNTTHLTQPLDKGVFGPLKTYWHQECHDFLRRNPRQVITDFSFMRAFSRAFSRAWGRAMTIPNAQAAFRTTGVYPFDRSAVKIDETLPEVSESLTKATGLSFIPLYSPAHPRRNTSIPKARSTETVPLSLPISASCSFTDSPVPPTDHSLTILPFDNHLEDPPTDYDIDNLDTPSDYDLASSHSNLLLRSLPPKESVIKKFFPSCRPHIQKPLNYEKARAKVLTSVENRKIIAEKERVKREREGEKKAGKGKEESRENCKGEKDYISKTARYN